MRAKSAISPQFRRESYTQALNKQNPPSGSEPPIHVLVISVRRLGCLYPSIFDGELVN